MDIVKRSTDSASAAAVAATICDGLFIRSVLEELIKKLNLYRKNLL